MPDDIGWISVDNAETYFETRFNGSEWDTLGEEQQEAVLMTAYNRIRYCSKFSIPSTPTIPQKEKLGIAQCEMALYLIIHLTDEDRRKGLQAQGVVSAGIVKETYSEKNLNELPIPPFVMAILDDFKVDESHFGAVDLARDEEESVKTKVHDF